MCSLHSNREVPGGCASPGLLFEFFQRKNGFVSQEAYAKAREEARLPMGAREERMGDRRHEGHRHRVWFQEEKLNLCEDRAQLRCGKC